jgi:hypothetical protein
MASGIRIQTDLIYANKTITVEHPLRPSKNYHFRLGDDAAVIVSEVVWRRVLELMQHVPGMPHFVAASEVRQPPTQGIGGAARMRPLLAVLDGSLVEVGVAPIPTLSH